MFKAFTKQVGFQAECKQSAGLWWERKSPLGFLYFYYGYSLFTKKEFTIRIIILYIVL